MIEYDEQRFLQHIKALPFADSNAGISETQVAMWCAARQIRSLTAENAALRKRLGEAEGVVRALDAAGLIPSTGSLPRTTKTAVGQAALRARLFLADKETPC